MAKALAFTLAIFVTIAAFLFYRTGYFKDVEIQAQTLGPYTLMFKDHQGEYHKITSVIEAVETFAKDKGQGCEMAFGRYLDDPDQVDHDRLRSQGGCISSNPEAFVSLQGTEGLKFENLPAREYIVASFNGSPSIGPFVVYPKVKDWMKKYGYKIDGPVIEIYKTLPDQSVLTRYLFIYATE
ncbi:MAG: GyrI-like domain-containing protein [Bdellovibrionales bacterium]|nr:GyrI-like domain-containing protein [Bdellovibrionales bacterium]